MLKGSLQSFISPGWMGSGIIYLYWTLDFLSAEIPVSLFLKCHVNREPSVILVESPSGHLDATLISEMVSVVTTSESVPLALLLLEIVSNRTFYKILPFLCE